MNNNDPSWYSNEEFEAMFNRSNQQDQLDATTSQPSNLDAAISSDYDFNIAAAIRRGWQETRGIKFNFFLATIMLGCASSALSTFWDKIPTLVASWLGLDLALGFELNLYLLPTETISMLLLDGLIYLISTGTATAIIIGLFALALRHLRQQDSPIEEAFKPIMALFIPAFFAGAIFALLVTLGLLCLIIPGIYLAVAYCLFEFIIIDNPDISAWRALESSRKIVQKRWFKFFGLSVALLLLNVIGALCLLVGLLWTIPASYLTLAALYDDIVNRNS